MDIQRLHLIGDGRTFDRYKLAPGRGCNGRRLRAESIKTVADPLAASDYKTVDDEAPLTFRSDAAHQVSREFRLHKGRQCVEQPGCPAHVCRLRRAWIFLTSLSRSIVIRVPPAGGAHLAWVGRDIAAVRSTHMVFVSSRSFRHDCANCFFQSLTQASAVLCIHFENCAPHPQNTRPSRPFQALQSQNLATATDRRHLMPCGSRPARCTLDQPSY
jgi:hypothetical protein